MKWISADGLSEHAHLTNGVAQSGLQFPNKVKLGKVRCAYIWTFPNSEASEKNYKRTFSKTLKVCIHHIRPAVSLCHINLI